MLRYLLDSLVDDVGQAVLREVAVLVVRIGRSLGSHSDEPVYPLLAIARHWHILPDEDASFDLGTLQLASRHTLVVDGILQRLDLVSQGLVFGGHLFQYVQALRDDDGEVAELSVLQQLEDTLGVGVVPHIGRHILADKLPHLSLRFLYLLTSYRALLQLLLHQPDVLRHTAVGSDTYRLVEANEHLLLQGAVEALEVLSVFEYLVSLLSYLLEGLRHLAASSSSRA